MMERAQLKQRLVGAAVLIAVAVIVIPFALDFGHERDWWGHRSSVPAPPAQGFVTRVLPLEQWSKQAESELATGTAPLDTPPQPPAPVAAPSAPPSKPAAPPSAPAAPSAGAAPPAGPPATSPSTASAAVAPRPPAALTSPVQGEAWVVQLGSFSSKKNADDLLAFLDKKGFKGFVEHKAQGGDSVFRVRIGPERDKARAEALRDRVEREAQVRAIVLRYP